MVWELLDGFMMMFVWLLVCGFRWKVKRPPRSVDRAGVGCWGLELWVMGGHSMAARHEPDRGSCSGTDEDPWMTSGDFEDETDDCQDDHDFSNDAYSHDFSCVWVGVNAACPPAPGLVPGEVARRVFLRWV